MQVLKSGCFYAEKVGVTICNSINNVIRELLWVIIKSSIFVFEWSEAIGDYNYYIKNGTA